MAVRSRESCLSWRDDKKKLTEPSRVSGSFESEPGRSALTRSCPQKRRDAGTDGVRAVKALQNFSVRDICQSRGTSWLVTVPNAELVGVVFGVNRFGWLKALMHSAR